MTHHGAGGGADTWQDAGHSVPYALDAGQRVVAPEQTLRSLAAGPASFKCAACGESITPVRAYTRRYRQADAARTLAVPAHFTHRRGTACRASRETVEHLCAKYLLAQRLEDLGTVGGAVIVEMTCGACGRQHTLTMTLPAGTLAGVEVRCGPYRLDVGVLTGPEGAGEASPLFPDAPADPGGVLLGVEVLVAHEVPEGKAEGLRVPWVEVRVDVWSLLAETVLTDAGSGEADHAARRAEETRRRAAAAQKGEYRRAQEAAHAREAARLAALGNRGPAGGVTSRRSRRKLPDAAGVRSGVPGGARSGLAGTVGAVPDGGGALPGVQSDAGILRHAGHAHLPALECADPPSQDDRAPMGVAVSSVRVDGPCPDGRRVRCAHA